MRHFEGLDAKAGILLGFAAALVALAIGERGLLARIGTGLAVASALAAVWAFFPRLYPVLDLRNLRERYLRAEPAFTKLALMDTSLYGVSEDMRIPGRQLIIHSGIGSLRISEDVQSEARRTELFPGTLTYASLPT